MQPPEVRKQIASGATAPLYLLEGDDRQSRHDLALEFGALVDEGLHAFNVHSFYANEATSAGARDQLIGQMLAAARTLPMMAPRRVLLVHEAERLLSPRKAADDEAEAAPAAAASKRRRSLTPVEELEAYLAAPEQLTTIVFVAAGLDANRRLVKLVRRHAISVDCGTLGSADEASRWIKARLEKESLAIEPQAVTLLLQITGLDLARIRAEVEKLSLFASGEPSVTAGHVRELVMPQAEEGEAFALMSAIRNNNAREALREIGAQFANGFQAPMILGQIRAALRPPMSDDRIRRALDAVFEADLAIKSSMAEPRFLLERLVIEMCGSR